MGVWDVRPPQPRHRPGMGGFARRIPQVDSRTPEGRHHRIALRHRRLPRAANPGRRKRVERLPTPASRARDETDPRFRAEPHGPGSSMARPTARIVRSKSRGNTGNVRAKDPRRHPLACAWKGSEFPALDGHSPARLPLPRHAGGDVENPAGRRRAMRRPALRHGDAGLERRVRKNLGEILPGGAPQHHVCRPARHRPASG